MPLATVQSYLKQQLNGLNLPAGHGTLTAFIEPPTADDGAGANLYIWGSHGDEKRMTVPRAQHDDLGSGGNKEIKHRVDMWLVWFGSVEDPGVDNAFPSIIDAVMAVVRNLELLDAAQHAVDPVTGQTSNLLDVGENMSWEYAPVRAMEDQRYRRYDARITVEITEVFRA